MSLHSNFRSLIYFKDSILDGCLTICIIPTLYFPFIIHTLKKDHIFQLIYNIKYHICLRPFLCNFYCFSTYHYRHIFYYRPIYDDWTPSHDGKMLVVNHASDLGVNNWYVIQHLTIPFYKDTMIFNDFMNKYLPIMTKVTIQANSEILEYSY